MTVAFITRERTWEERVGRPGTAKRLSLGLAPKRCRSAPEKLFHDPDDAGGPAGLAPMSAHAAIAVLVGLGLGDTENEPSRWGHADEVIWNKNVPGVKEGERGPGRREGFARLEEEL